MNKIQIYSVINSLAEQALGMTDLEPTDSNFVDVGKASFSSADNTSAMYGVLIDRIGRTVVSMRKYESESTILRREPFAFGASLQKLQVPLLKARENTSWKSQNSPHSDQFEKFPTTVQQKFFNKIALWEVDSTIYNTQLKTAFLDAEKMFAFIDAITMSAYNTMNVAYENADKTCRNRIIAEAFPRAINLLAAYNKATGNSLTVAKCLVDADFLSYAAMLIDLYSQRFSTMSRTFNDGSIDRHTKKEYLALTMLADFDSALTARLKANTFHENLIRMPGYEKTTCWQGSGEKWDFEDVSGIDITYDTVVNGTMTSVTNFVQSGVLAVMHDIESGGTTIMNERTGSAYNSRDEYTNYFMKAEIGYFADASENALVFYVADETAKT